MAQLTGGVKMRGKKKDIEIFQGHQRSTVSANERERLCRLVSGDGGPALGAGHVRLRLK